METTTKLTGAALKAKVDEMIKAGEGFSACCRATGYMNVTKTGTKIPSASVFSRALLDSIGYEFPTGSGGGGGRARDGKVRVLGAGNALISKGYVRDANIQPGDQMSVTISDDGTITLEVVEESATQNSLLETVREPVSDDWTTNN